MTSLEIAPCFASRPSPRAGLRASRGRGAGRRPSDPRSRRSRRPRRVPGTAVGGTRRGGGSVLAVSATIQSSLRAVEPLERCLARRASAPDLRSSRRPSSWTSRRRIRAEATGPAGPPLERITEKARKRMRLARRGRAHPRPSERHRERRGERDRPRACPTSGDDHARAASPAPTASRGGRRGSKRRTGRASRVDARRRRSPITAPQSRARTAISSRVEQRSSDRRRSGSCSPTSTKRSGVEQEDRRSSQTGRPCIRISALETSGVRQPSRCPTGTAAMTPERPSARRAGRPRTRSRAEIVISTGGSLSGLRNLGDRIAHGEADRDPADDAVDELEVHTRSEKLPPPRRPPRGRGRARCRR